MVKYVCISKDINIVLEYDQKTVFIPSIWVLLYACMCVYLVLLSLDALLVLLLPHHSAFRVLHPALLRLPALLVHLIR
jgi:hypothetical protein